MQFISRVSVHAGRNYKLHLSTHGHLPVTLQYVCMYVCMYEACGATLVICNVICIPYPGRKWPSTWVCMYETHGTTLNFVAPTSYLQMLGNIRGIP